MCFKEPVTPINAVNSLWYGVSEATPLFVHIGDKLLETLEERPTFLMKEQYIGKIFLK